MMRILIGVLVGAGLGGLMGHFGKCSSGACPLTSTPTRGALYGGILGLSMAFAMGANTLSPRGSEAGLADRALHIEDAEQFDEVVLKASVPVLVDFYSDSCPPCRRLAPTIGKLAERYEGRAIVAKANLDGGRNGELARRYGVQQIPNVVFFRDGEVAERVIGLQGEDHYAGILDKLVTSMKSSKTEDDEGEAQAQAEPSASR